MTRSERLTASAVTTNFAHRRVGADLLAAGTARARYREEPELRPSRPLQNLVVEDLAGACRGFLRDIAGDELVVLHDDGPYRHLRFAFPGSPIGTYELMTWPGRLAVDASAAHLLFVLASAERRQHPDAFDLFDLGGRIDPEGWVHLLRPGSAHATAADPVFLWSCCAIAYGIAEYRSLRAAVPAVRAA